MVEHLKVLISRAPKGPYGRAPKGPYGRAPKGDGGLISRACLRILISRAPCRVLWLPFQKVSRADGGLNSLKERLTRPHLRSQSSGPLLKSGRLTPGSQVGVRARFPFAGG